MVPAARDGEKPLKNTLPSTIFSILAEHQLSLVGQCIAEPGATLECTHLKASRVLAVLHALMSLKV